MILSPKKLKILSFLLSDHRAYCFLTAIEEQSNEHFANKNHEHPKLVINKHGHDLLICSLNCTVNDFMVMTPLEQIYHIVEETVDEGSICIRHSLPSSSYY